MPISATQQKLTPMTDPIKVFVHLPFGLDADEYRTRFNAGLEPDETPYGFHNATALGYSVKFSQSAKLTGVTGFAFRVIAKITSRDLVHAWFNRAHVREAAVVWTLLEDEAIPLGLLMRLRLIPRRQLLASAVWMMDKWPTLTQRRRAIIHQSSKCWSTLLLQSDRGLKQAKATFPNVNSELMLFGISSSTFGPIAYDPQSQPIHVVAPGNDKTRDWKTLTEALGNQPNVNVTIICKWLDDSTVADYPNIRVAKISSTEQLIEIYKSATVMAIPMKENIFSGITVAIEAASMGIPVICSDTGGVSTYFSPEEVKYVAPGDTNALREGLAELNPDVLKIISARARNRFLSADYSTTGMVARYAAITQRITSPQRR
jgi:hypothetical protein